MGEEGKKLAQMVQQFEAENPDVQVTLQAIPWGAVHEKLITAVAGRTTPDVCQLGTTWVPEFAAIRALEPLRDYVKYSSYVQEEYFLPGAWKTCLFNGQLYSIPWYVETRVLFYRKDLLQEAGFDHPPRTWEELLTIGKALARDIDGDGRMERYGISLPAVDWQHFIIFLWQAGGHILDESNRQAVMDTPEAAATLDFYTRLFEEKVTPLVLSPVYDIPQSFKSGFLPMFISGPWEVQLLRQQVPEIEGKWEVAVLPAKKFATSYIGGSNWVIFKASKNKTTAWKFIEFMARTDSQVEWYRISQDLPAVTAAWDDPVLAQQKIIQVFREQLKQVKSPPAIANWEQVASLINKYMELAVLRKMTAGETLRALNQEVNKLLHQSKKSQSTQTKILVLGLIFVVVLALAYLYFRSPRKESKQSFWKTLRRYQTSYLFLMPSLVILLIFLLLPILFSFVIGLTNWDIYSLNNWQEISFIGLDNFKHMVKDAIFWKSVGNTFYFVFVAGPLSIFLSLVAAIFLNSGVVKLRNLFRVGYFMPVVTTMVAVAVVWRWIYNPQFGVLNWLLGFFHIPAQNWLSDVRLAMPALILMAAWKNFGYNMVIFLAGLQGIPTQFYEAAAIDGATPWQSFGKITLPLLKPVTLLVAVMTTIGYFQFFAEPYIMTGGGPLNSTLSVALLMYREGFRFFKLGYASAMAYFLFGIIVVFSMVQFKLTRAEFEY